MNIAPMLFEAVRPAPIFTSVLGKRYVYMLGGTVTGNGQRYDLDQDLWEQVAPLPKGVPRKSAFCATNYANRLIFSFQ
jgi:hypothetical protein